MQFRNIYKALPNVDLKKVHFRENVNYSVLQNIIENTPEKDLVKVIKERESELVPKYITTGVSESRAILHIQNSNHSDLKSKYQKNFEKFWQEKKSYLFDQYGISSWQAVCNNGTKQTNGLTDFSVSARGGLKIIFYNEEKNPISFIWMRGSGTESAFRVMCDVKVLDNSEISLTKATEFEKELLEYHSNLIKLSDSI